MKPILPVLLMRPFQLPEMMGVAKNMGANIAKIGLPVIMNELACKMGQYSHPIHGGLSSFFVKVKQRQFVAAKAVDPEKLALQIGASFIAMQKRGRDQLGASSKLKAQLFQFLRRQHIEVKCLSG